jgi:GAF domain-containing protein
MLAKNGPKPKILIFMSSSPLPAAVVEALASGTPSDVLAATLSHFDCQAGTIHRVEEGVLKLVTSANIPPHIVQIVGTVPIGKGIAGLAAERREPITLCNLQTDTSGQALPAAKQTGMEGSLAVPMLSSGNLRGVLGIAKSGAYDWSKEETALLLAIAAELGALV